MDTLKITPIVEMPAVSQVSIPSAISMSSPLLHSSLWASEEDRIRYASIAPEESDLADHTIFHLGVLDDCLESSQTDDTDDDGETLETVTDSWYETASGVRIDIESKSIDIKNPKPASSWMGSLYRGVSFMASAVIDFIEEGLVDPHLCE